MNADIGSIGEDSDHVEPQCNEVRFSSIEVMLSDGAQGALLARSDGFERVSIAGSATQLDLDEDEGVVLAHYQVDLPAPGPVVAIDECVTVLDQVERSARSSPHAPGDLSFSLPPRRS